jgi:thiol:disulfide interchange protein DsbC
VNKAEKPVVAIGAAKIDAAKTETPAYTPLTCANPIAELDEIGKSMGVDGTPAIFGPQGEHLGGYIPPEQLAQRLDQIAQRAQPDAAK